MCVRPSQTACPIACCHDGKKAAMMQRLKHRGGRRMQPARPCGAVRDVATRHGKSTVIQASSSEGALFCAIGLVKALRDPQRASPWSSGGVFSSVFPGGVCHDGARTTSTEAPSRYRMFADAHEVISNTSDAARCFSGWSYARQRSRRARCAPRLRHDRAGTGGYSRGSVRLTLGLERGFSSLKNIIESKAYYDWPA